MIGRIKDKALSRCIAFAFRTKIGSFATMRDFRLDTRGKRIEMLLLLKGEETPMHIVIEEYEIVREDGEYFLRAGRIVSSKEWINEMAALYLRKLRLPIPEQYAKMLKLLV